MTNQTPALLVWRSPWTKAAVMCGQFLYFSRFLPSRLSPPKWFRHIILTILRKSRGTVNGLVATILLLWLRHVRFWLAKPVEKILSIASDNLSTKKAAFKIAENLACCLEHPDPKVIWNILSKPWNAKSRCREKSLQLYFYPQFWLINIKTKGLCHRNCLVDRVCRRYFSDGENRRPEIRLCSQATIITSKKLFECRGPRYT